MKFKEIFESRCSYIYWFKVWVYEWINYYKRKKRLKKEFKGLLNKKRQKEFIDLLLKKP